MLRERGLGKAAERSGRENTEGAVAVAVAGDVAALVELKSETDFVAKNEDFLAYARALADLVLAKSPQDVAALGALPFGAGTKTVCLLPSVSAMVTRAGTAAAVVAASTCELTSQSTSFSMR